MFWNILQNFRPMLEHSKSFDNVLEDSRSFKNVPELSTMFWNIPEAWTPCTQTDRQADGRMDSLAVSMCWCLRTEFDCFRSQFLEVPAAEVHRYSSSTDTTSDSSSDYSENPGPHNEVETFSEKRKRLQGSAKEGFPHPSYIPDDEETWESSVKILPSFGILL